MCCGVVTFHIEAANISIRHHNLSIQYLFTSNRQYHIFLIFYLQMAKGGNGNFVFKYANDDDEYGEGIAIESILANPNDENILGGLALRIIAKTDMGGGFCYLALDETNDQRILRPICKRSQGQYCWPKQSFEFKLDHLYNFQVIAHPKPDTVKCWKPILRFNEDMIGTEMQTILQSPLNSSSYLVPGALLQDMYGYFTPYPHCNEDLIVTETDFVELPEVSPQPPLQSLLSLAKSDVEDIFGSNVIKEHKYIDEQTDCSSAGILKCKALYLEHNGEKYYCKVRCASGIYNMPVKVIGIGGIDTQPIIYRSDALIVIGLARPFKGDQGQFNPARCYLLVVGIYHPLA